MKTVTRGIIHGNTVQLPQPTSFIEGQEVLVTLEAPESMESATEALRRSAGGWSDEVEELDRYLEWNRQQRKASRRDLDS